MTDHDAHSDEDWKKIRISDIDLSVRTSNCLYRMGLTKLGDLALVSDAELLRQPNFGRKCLTEVRTLLSSIGGLTSRAESPSENDKLDFHTIAEPLFSTLLQPVQVLDLTTRARNVLANLVIQTVGELVQLTELELLHTPNVGRLTVDNLREELWKLGLSLGTEVANWPNKDELIRILASREPSRLRRTQTPAGAFTFLEDELCAAVRMTVDHSGYMIVVRRTGWDGADVLTLEELGNNPAASGRKSLVSRERIRQIENKVLETIQRKAWSMPILERTVSLIEKNAPLAVATLPSMLKRNQLSQRGLGFEALSSAMRTFKVGWSLVCRSIGEYLFLLPRDRADTMESAWTSLIKEANRRDFVPLDEIESSDLRTSYLGSDVVSLGVSKIPTLDWLDDLTREIFWSLERAHRGWNKIINVCRKILTVAPDVPIQRLAKAVKRARTIREYPSSDVLMSMLREMDDFDVHDGIVSQGADFKPVNLSSSDRLMISAAKDTGTVTTFLKLREALVRQGLSANYAQVLMVVTPLWITLSRGKYRFIANRSQLTKLSLAAPTINDAAEENLNCFVELVISHRHLMTGTHRIDENVVRPGQWSLRDEADNDLGKLDVTASLVKGLDYVCVAAGIVVGAVVIIDFSDEQFMATIYY